MAPTTLSTCEASNCNNQEAEHTTEHLSALRYSCEKKDNQQQSSVSKSKQYDHTFFSNVDRESSHKEGSTDMNEGTNKPEKRSGRGKGFTQDEKLFLAKAWIEQSAKGCNQREKTMWAGIEDICRRKYKMDRSSPSLRSTWHRVARETQHFLAARSRVKLMNISGANDELLDDIVQEQYQKRAGRKAKDGIIVYAAPYKLISTADYLSEQDKFSDEGGKKKARSNSTKESTTIRMEAVGKECADERSRAQPYMDKNVCVAKRREIEEALLSSDEEIRPKGIKKRKLEEKNAKEDSRVTDTLRGIQASLVEGNRILRQETERSELERQEVQDVELLKLLDPKSSEFKEIMADVMSCRRRRVKRYTNGSQKCTVPRIRNDCGDGDGGKIE